MMRFQTGVLAKARMRGAASGRAATMAAVMAALSVSLWWTVTGFGKTPQTSTRIFAVVHDASGAPVTDLSADDFVVRLDGRDVEVIAARLTEEPPCVVLLTDQLGLTTAYPLADLRQSMAAFVERLRQHDSNARFALVTFDGSLRVRADFDTGPVRLREEINRLVGVSETAVLLDGVARAAQLLMSAPSDRRLIVALFSAYRPDTSAVRSDELGETLRQSGASLWSVEAVASVGWRQAEGQGTSPAGNVASAPRELVVSEGGVRSGGTRVTVTNRVELRQAFEQLGTLIAAQYEVIYASSPGTVRAQRLVGVRRQDVRVLAPSWVSR